MIIVKAEKEDLQKILDLQYLAYQSEARLFDSQDIPPLKQTLADVENEYRKGIILKALDEDNTIIGSVRAFCDNGTVNIGKLMVHPSKQSQGIGTRLLLEMEKQFPKQRYELFTSTRSKKNIAFYKKIGYRIFDEKQVTEELKFVYMRKERTMPFTEVCIYQVKPQKVEEFESLMFEAKEFLEKQEGLLMLRLIKRGYRIDMPQIKEGLPPLQITRIVKSVKYVLYWEFDTKESYGAAQKNLYESYWKSIEKCLVMPHDKYLGEVLF